MLTDVLKTEVGKAFLDKRLGRACSKQAQMVSERNPRKKEAVKCRGQKPPSNDMNKSAMPKCIQKRTPSSLQR